MEDTIEHEKFPIDNDNNKNDDSQYVDCIRLVEGGHIRRFENIVAKFDIVQYELNDEDDGPAKPLIFYAIEHNDETFVKVLFEMEVSLDKSYSVSRRIRYFGKKYSMFFKSFK
jgi:hypothetical protein